MGTIKLLALFILAFCINSVYASSEDSLKIVQKKQKQFLKSFDAYRYIPGGSSTVPVTEGTDLPQNMQSGVIEVESFFMYCKEVTNIDYLECLHYYKLRDKRMYQQLLPDTTVWTKDGLIGGPLVEHYLRHPAYQRYPLVGISYEQAVLYCQWLTEVYHQNPDRTFKKVVYRLPTENEWIYAASGGDQKAVYPWAGWYMRDADGNIKANCINFGTETVFRDTLYQKDANGHFVQVPIYRALPYDFMGAAGTFNDGADVTAPAQSYWPNDYGLYNMAGNVAEMVAEPGITHGGSWRDPGAYLRIAQRQFYTDQNSASATRGFRFVMEVIEY